MSSVKSLLSCLSGILLLVASIAPAQPQNGGPSFSVPAFIHALNFEKEAGKSAYFYYQSFHRAYANKVVHAEGAIHFPEIVRPALIVVGGGFYQSIPISEKIAATAIFNIEVAAAKDAVQIPYYLWIGLRYPTGNFSFEPTGKIMLMRYAHQKIREFRFSLRYKKRLRKTAIHSSVSIGVHRRIHEDFSIAEPGFEFLYFFSISRIVGKNLSIALFWQGRLRSDYIRRSSAELESRSPSLAYRIVYDNPQAHSIGLLVTRRIQFSAIVDIFSKNKAPGRRAIANFPIQ